MLRGRRLILPGALLLLLCCASPASRGADGPAPTPAAERAPPEPPPEWEERHRNLVLYFVVLTGTFVLVIGTMAGIHLLWRLGVGSRRIGAVAALLSLEHRRYFGKGTYRGCRVTVATRRPGDSSAYFLGYDFSTPEGYRFPTPESYHHHLHMGWVGIFLDLWWSGRAVWELLRRGWKQPVHVELNRRSLGSLGWIHAGRKLAEEFRDIAPRSTSVRPGLLRFVVPRGALAEEIVRRIEFAIAAAEETRGTRGTRGGA